MKRILSVTLLALGLGVLWLPVSGWGAHYYVDNTANGLRNGTSWANAWTSITNVSNVTGGDTIYISGGTTSKTYSVRDWVPASSGVSGRPIVYRVGQETGHNGIVVFDGGGSGTWWAPHEGEARHYTEVDGNYNGARHITLQNYGGIAIYADQCVGLTFRYITLTGQVRAYSADKIELDHLYMNPCTGVDGQIRMSGTGGDYNSNSVHHCTLNLYYQHGANGQGGNGDDGIQNASYITIANNVFMGVYVSTFTGSQHQDGIQTGGPYVRITGNYFENMANYMIYGEYFGSGGNMQVYNNVINYADPVLTTQPSCGIAIGSSAAGINISNIIVANNTMINGGRGMSIGKGYPNTTMTNSFVVNNLLYGSGMDNLTSSGLAQTNNVTLSSGAVAFVDAAGKDFRLAANSTGLIDAGASWPATYFTIDKDGVTRPQGSAWDIGAYEYFTASPISFTASPRLGEPPLAVTFTNTSTGTYTAWRWNFGDGYTSVVQAPSHTYQAAGTYTVTLIGTRTNGSDTAIIRDYITVKLLDLVIEAENMILSNGYLVDTAGMSSQGIKVDPNLPVPATGKATATFAGASGTYDITFFAVPENDGRPKVKLYVNTTKILDTAYTMDFGYINLMADRQQFTVKGVSVPQGAQIWFEGTSDSEAFARVDKIVLAPVTGIEDFGLRIADCPASPRLIAPNPVEPELLTHCLQENKDLVLFDMTGAMITPGTIKEHGFYVVQDQKKMLTQKVMVIK